MEVNGYWVDMIELLLTNITTPPPPVHGEVKPIRTPSWINMAKKMTVHIFSEVGGTYAKDGLIRMLSNKRPDVEFKDIKLGEGGK